MEKKLDDIPVCFVCFQLLGASRQDVVRLETCNHCYCVECILNFLDIQKEELLRRNKLVPSGISDEDSEKWSEAKKYAAKKNQKVYYCLKCQVNFDAADIKAYTHHEDYINQQEDTEIKEKKKNKKDRKDDSEDGRKKKKRKKSYDDSD